MILYKYTTLNDKIFKSGRYAVFSQFAASSYYNISSYNTYGQYQAKFYKVKLLHQLNNGYLDLTEDVWKKYVSAGLTGGHWYGDSNFKYYCPNQYKGKLAARIEIEDIYNFRLNNIPAVTTDGTTFTVKLQVDLSLKKDVLLGFGSIDIDSLVVDYTINNTTTSLAVPVTSTLDPVTITITGISIDDIDKLMTYKITPKVKMQGYTDIYYAELPQEFFDIYTINGILRLSTDLGGISFAPVSGNTFCDETNVGYEVNNEYILTDETGAFLDNTLTVTSTPHVFIREGFSVYTPGAVTLGIFTITDNHPVVLTPTTLPLDDVVITLFERTVSETPSAACAPAETVTLTITFNSIIVDTVSVMVDQTGVASQVKSGDGTNTLSFTILKNVNTKVTVSSGFIYEQIVLDNLIYSGNGTLNLGLIAKVNAQFQNLLGATLILAWTAGSELLGVTPLVYSTSAYNTVSMDTITADVTLVWNAGILQYIGSSNYGWTSGTSFIKFNYINVKTYDDLTGTFDNISADDITRREYVSVGGIIFKRRISL